MAFFDASQTIFDPRAAFGRVAAGLRAMLDTPFARRQRLIQARIAAFRSLSDAELAQIGLRRDQILAHVFRTTPRSGRFSG